MKIWLPCDFGDELPGCTLYWNQQCGIMSLPFNMITYVNEMVYYTTNGSYVGNIGKAKSSIGINGKVLDTDLYPGYKGRINEWFEDYTGEYHLTRIAHIKGKFQYTFSDGSTVHRIYAEELIGSVYDNDNNASEFYGIKCSGRVKVPDIIKNSNPIRKNRSNLTTTKTNQLSLF